MKKSKDRIPDEVLKEIFPKRLNRSLATGQIVCRQEAVEVRSWQSRTANKEGIKGFQGGGWQKGSWK
jgi:hypothetical protein